MPATETAPQPHLVNPAESREIFDRAARRYLGISGDEFIAAWEAGELDDDAERPEVARVAMLLPLVGR
jgi:hypothetical protein